MVESKQDKIFNTKVIPIMNKVRNDLQNKLANELRSNSNSFAGLMAAAAEPDGGMASMQAQNDTLKYTGKWTSKTTEDYIAMVKKELKRQHITVNASMEQKMIDKMIKDKHRNHPSTTSCERLPPVPSSIYRRKSQNRHWSKR